MRKFLIETTCPYSTSGVISKKILGILPLKVALSRKRPRCPPNGCEKKKYVVTKADGNEIRALVGLPPGLSDFSVCEHMGHLIE